MSDTDNVKKEMDIIRKAMKDDPGFAYSWHCNIAMMCHDAFLDADIIADNRLGGVHAASNDAASRIMKLVFDVETKHETS